MPYRALVISFLVLLVVVAVLAGQLPVFADKYDAPDGTEISDIPWDPAALEKPGSQAKVIYGVDDRIDVYQETDPDRQAWAAATCAQIATSKLSLQPDGSYTLSPSGYNVCSYEAFSSQPTAAHCSAFWVGGDLVVTAGHCYDTEPLAGYYLVFGFVMQNSSTAVTSFDANQVYQAVEKVSCQNASDGDYCVVRLDRPVNIPGVVPLQIRRTGTVPLNTQVGVIGHPSGLPMKIAFGVNTLVRSNTDPYEFMSNLDTYGGNSGSPVFNAQTGVVEGILVSGEVDFLLDSANGCYYSNELPDTYFSPEDVTKTTLFADHIPEITGGLGELQLSRTAYTAPATLEITVVDDNVTGTDTVSVAVTTSGGDDETVILTREGVGSDSFSGSINLAAAAVSTGNSQLEVQHAEEITVVYHDADNGSGGAEDVTETADVDLIAPSILTIDQTYIGTTQSLVKVVADEECYAEAHFGVDCDTLTNVAEGILETEHRLVLAPLLQGTEHAYYVQVIDPAGNSTESPVSPTCYAFTARDSMDYVTRFYNTEAFDLQLSSVSFLPEHDGSGYVLCKDSITEFNVSAGDATTLSLADDGVQEVALPVGKTFNFFGCEYDAFYVSANGYITFEQADSSYEPSISQHFSLPRIAFLYTDLNPASLGRVSVKSIADRVVVTFENVPEYGSFNGNYCQVELFFHGPIRISWLGIHADELLMGLSPGLGEAIDFQETDFAGLPDCTVSDRDLDGLSDAEEIALGTDADFNDSDNDGLLDGWEVDNQLDPLSDVGADGATGNPDGDGLDNAAEQSNGTLAYSADSDRDGVADDVEVGAATDPTGANEPHTADLDDDKRIDLSELLRLVQLAHLGDYHCDGTTEDGYAPDTGATTCLVHHADYDTTSWVFSMTELERAGAFFAASGYVRDLYSVDTFAPAP